MCLVNTIYIAQAWGLKAEKQSVGKLDTVTRGQELFHHIEMLLRVTIAY